MVHVEKHWRMDAHVNALSMLFQMRQDRIASAASIMPITMQQLLLNLWFDTFAV